MFTGPPPLTKDSVNNGLVWIAALCPLINLVNPDLWWIAFAVVPILWLDAIALRKAGHDTSRFDFWCALLVPAYLYRRASALKQPKTYFIANILAICLVIFMQMNAGPDTSQMAQAIQSDLTKKYASLGLTCQKVTVLHKSGNDYTGLAEMSGGQTLSVEIVADGDHFIWKAE